jgi:3-oxoacyl-[acyl-carrier protein] reductase
MDMGLAGKRALVTGSSAGLGEAIAKMLAGEGVGIIVHGRHEGRTEAVANSIRDSGGFAISMVRMIKKLAPPMRERGWGRVIQIGGGLAIQPDGSHPHYTASLGARHNLTVSLARELRGSGVTSNTVAPGAILVPAVEHLLRATGERRGWGETWEEIEEAAVREMVPNDVGRLGRPEEIAAATVYLASPLADYVSGATIRVDGGTVRTV